MKLHWGNAIFIFFVFFIGLSITFIVFSLRQDVELVEDDYYEQGANYSIQMQVQQRSAAFADSIIVENNAQSILIKLPGTIYSNTDTLKVHFYNPSSKSKDYKLLLLNLSDSVFIKKTNITSGRYTIKINWKLTQEDYLIEKTIDIN